MAELKDRLRADLNDAMRARDQVRMRTLRMALTSITMRRWRVLRPAT